MIETSELSKRFGDLLAVDRVSLSVQPSEVVALLGPNGAGKTTTVRVLTSILQPSGGWARVAGYDVVREAVAVRAHIGVLTEHHGLYLRMRADEYLEFFGELYGLTPAACRARARDLLERFGLAGASKRRLGEFSKGMRQKLALVRALLHDPPVLLLDEPTSAMDPQSARLVRDSILEMRSGHRAVLITTHNLAEAELLADRIVILRQGQVVAEGTPAELKNRLLGPSVFELRLAVPMNGAVHELLDGAELAQAGPDWLHFRTADPARTNPRILGRLAERGIPVLTLAEVPRSLEDVYLRVVGDSSATSEIGRAT